MDIKKTALNLLGFVGIIVAVLVAIYLCIYFWPFMVGVLIAIILERGINFITKKTKISRKSVGTMMVIIFYIILAMLITLLLITLIKEIIDISLKIPDIYNDLQLDYEELYGNFKSLMSKTPDTIINTIYDIGKNALAEVINIVKDVVNSAINIIMSLPNLMVYIIVTFLATLFIVTDRRVILKGANEILPPKFTRKIINVISMSIKSLGSYLKAQCILISITFVELLVAFFILKQPYPLTLALIVALVDALPILGTGTVLIPWSIYSFITGDIILGIALLVVYVIILIVRQLVEPKIVGEKIGVHPFLTLLAMYIGFRLLGLIGMIVGPVILVIFKNVFGVMFEVGYFKKLFVYQKKEKK